MFVKWGKKLNILNDVIFFMYVLVLSDCGFFLSFLDISFILKN